MPRIGLIGVTGYGRTHLRAAVELERQGRAELVAYADVTPDAPAAVEAEHGGSVRGYQSYLQMFGDERLDIAVVSTPIQMHAEMIEQALSHGLHVLVEKPPVVTVQDFDRLLALQRANGLHCQVGFQTAFSDAIASLGAAVREGRLGDVELIGGVARWRRPDSYYARARWAGRLVMDGRLVLDGTLTNPLAHALMNCLLVAGDDELRPAAPESVQAELYRCREIESDDTSSVRIHTTNGRTIVLGTTLCAAEQTEPFVFAKGNRGTAVAHYTSGRMASEPAGLVPPVSAAVDRSGPLANLVDVVTGAADQLRCPFESTGSYVRAVNGMYESAGRPVPIPPEFLELRDDDGDRLVYLTGIEPIVERCVGEGALFSERGVAWARRTEPFPLAGYRSFDRFMEPA